MARRSRDDGPLQANLVEPLIKLIAGFSGTDHGYVLMRLKALHR
jgi:hypothetical protein